MERLLSKKGLIFAILFVAISLVGTQINFSKLIGAENQFFTMFQLWGPIAGGFLGSALGMVTVFLAQVAGLVIGGKQITLLSILRLAPMLIGAYYFSRATMGQNAFVIVACVAAMLSFWITPAGAAVWYYALYWTIPIIAIAATQSKQIQVAFEKFAKLAKNVPFIGNALSTYPQLFLISLGATFAAHAVGGLIWAWTVPMTASGWLLLVPVTAAERLIFAIGISISYIIFNNVLNAVDKAFDVSKVVAIDKRYLLG